MFRIMRDENSNNLHFFYEEYDGNTGGIFRKTTQIYYSSLEPVSEIPSFDQSKEAIMLKKEELDRFFAKGVPLVYHSSVSSVGEPPELGLVFTAASNNLDFISQASVSDDFFFEFVSISAKGKLSAGSSGFRIKNVAPYNFNNVIWKRLKEEATHILSVKNRSIIPLSKFDMSKLDNSFKYIPVRVNSDGLSNLMSFEKDLPKYHLEAVPAEELFHHLFRGNREGLLETFSETKLPTEDTKESAIELLYPNGYYLKYSSVFQVTTLEDGNKVIYAPTRSYNDSFLHPNRPLVSEGFTFTTDTSTAIIYAINEMRRAREESLVLKSKDGYEIIYRQTDTKYIRFSYTEDLYFKERNSTLFEDLMKEVVDLGWDFIPIKDKNNMLLRTLSLRGDSNFNRMVLVKGEEIIIVGDYLYERPQDGRLALHTVDIHSVSEEEFANEPSLDFQDIQEYLETGYELKKVHPFSWLMSAFSAFTKLAAVI